MPLYRVGITLHKGISLAYYLVTLVTVKVFWLLGAIAFFELLRFTGLDEEKRLLGALALGVGSLFTWSSTFNNHELASILSIGFYFFLKGRYEAASGRNLAVAGFFFFSPETADILPASFTVYSWPMSYAVGA